MTAPAPTDRAEQRERVLKAACDWVYDQSCSSALVELEDAVIAFIGVPLDELQPATPSPYQGLLPMNTHDAPDGDRLKNAIENVRRAVGDIRRDGVRFNLFELPFLLRWLEAAALSQARAVPDEVLSGLQQALVACENEANPGKRHKDYETVRKTLDAMLAAAPEPPVSPPPARVAVDLAEVERLVRAYGHAACARTGASFRDIGPLDYDAYLREEAAAFAASIAAIRQLATPDTEGRVAINDAMSDLKLHDPADEEAADWVIKNLHGLRRDDGSIEYTLRAVIRALQAGKAAVPPPPADEAAKPLDPVVNEEALGVARQWESWYESIFADFIGLTDNRHDPDRVHDWEWIDNNRPPPAKYQWQEPRKPLDPVAVRDGALEEAAQAVFAALNGNYSAYTRDGVTNVIRTLKSPADLPAGDAPRVRDYVYDPADWAITYDWADRGELLEGFDHGAVREFETLKDAGTVWGVADTESAYGGEFFENEADAKAASETLRSPPSLKHAAGDAPADAGETGGRV